MQCSVPLNLKKCLQRPRLYVLYWRWTIRLGAQKLDSRRDFTKIFHYVSFAFFFYLNVAVQNTPDTKTLNMSFSMSSSAIVPRSSHTASTIRKHIAVLVTQRVDTKLIKYRSVIMMSNVVCSGQAIDPVSLR